MCAHTTCLCGVGHLQQFQLCGLAADICHELVPDVDDFIVEGEALLHARLREENVGHVEVSHRSFDVLRPEFQRLQQQQEK